MPFSFAQHLPNRCRIGTGGVSGFSRMYRLDSSDFIGLLPDFFRIVTGHAPDSECYLRMSKKKGRFECKTSAASWEPDEGRKPDELEFWQAAI